MDMVGNIILLVYTGWTQSVRSHFPIDHTSVRLTQTHPKYWPNVHNQARRPRERYLRSDKEKNDNYSLDRALTPPKALIFHHLATKPLQLINTL